MAKLRTIVGTLAAAGVLGACAGAQDMASGGAGMAEAGFEEAPVGAPSVVEGDGSEEGSAGAGSSATTGASLPAVGPSVIKTADVGVEVGRGRFQKSIREVTTLAARYGGFLVASSVEGAEAREGTLTIRVPSDRFERALAEVRDLGRVKRESVEGREVGQEFVDLEARLRNLRAHEGVLLRLYAKANAIPTAIQVQKEVAGVQLEIERLEGRLRYLGDQTAFGTLTVRLREAGVLAPGPPGVLERAWDEAVGVTTGLVSAIVVGLGFALPIAVLMLLVFALVRRLWPRILPNR